MFMHVISWYHKEIKRMCFSQSLQLYLFIYFMLLTLSNEINYNQSIKAKISMAPSEIVMSAKYLDTNERYNALLWPTDIEILDPTYIRLTHFLYVLFIFSNLILTTHSSDKIIFQLLFKNTFSKKISFHKFHRF